MPSPVDEFRQHLAAQGKRLTREREIVASIVFSLRPPFTAEFVVAALGRDVRVSRATVYRTLSLLTDSGQVSVQSQSGPTPQYSHSYQSPSPTHTLSHLCESTHSSMIAGICPWCGCAIFDGQAEDR